MTTNMRQLIETVKSMNEVEIISHTESDEKHLIGLMTQMFNVKSRQFSMSSIGSINGLTIKSNDDFPSSNLRPWFFFLHGDDLVGFCVLEKIPPTPEGKMWFVKLIYLLPAYRGKETAIRFYEYVLSKNVELVCGDQQTLASRRNWEKLAQMGYDVDEIGDRLVARPKQPVVAEGHEDTDLILYHGTCDSNAEALCANGWRPNAGQIGANMGQTKYLYVSTGKDDALWFAQEKGCSAVVEIRGVPRAYLDVDPEDGMADSLEDELNDSRQIGLPAKLIIKKPIGPEHFTKIS